VRAAAASGAELAEAVSFVRARLGLEPTVGMILGTGLGELARAMQIDAEVAYAEIPHMPVPTVASHAGRVVAGRLAGRSVVALQGRYHHYEGHSLPEVVQPVRLLHGLGARTLVLAGACGGMHPLWRAGELVLITDHLNLIGDNPLAGANDDGSGARFPDMSAPYDEALIGLTQQCALDLGIPLRSGVYAAVAGPNLETRAEYRMLRAFGADVVGMSTAPEVIAARHAGMRVLAISIITDVCLPDALEPTDIDTIISTAARAEPVLADLLTLVLERMETLHA
jgi:purine-nucleoside phosphorylase